MTSGSDRANLDQDRTETLADTVFNLATDDDGLSERQKSMVLAAMESDEALAAELGDTSTPVRPERPANQAGVSPAGAFLRSITVSGFRGIGPEARLDLHPGPGLTIVAGRNGSGKSSFSEALEVALTGDSYRWSGRTALWSTSWRNLHQDEPCAIRVDLAEEGTGRTTIGVDWAAEAALGDRSVWTQRHGRTRTPGIDALDWQPALDLYRPILSYDELDRRLEGTPTDLYRALHSVLGLEQLTDAGDRLGRHLRRLKEPVERAKAAKGALREMLDSQPDARAGLVLAELRKHKPNLTVLSSLATGVGAPDELGALLRALSRIATPDGAEVSATATALLRALEAIAAAGAEVSSLARARTDLLERALRAHAEHGDLDCLVCGVGRLDDAWRQRTNAHLAAEKAGAAEWQTAAGELTEQRERAHALITRADLPDLPGDLSLRAMPAAREALNAWRNAPESDVELAAHLTARLPALIEAFDRLRAEAAAALETRDEGWRGIAESIARWLGLARQAEAVSADRKDVEVAATWLKSNLNLLQNQRFTPFAAQTQQIWAKLRQDSSIALDEVILSGTPRRGKVEIKASIDGVETAALPVMSQGELNAAALALFLPRATMPDSPLRFVVLDDPVQAMDPAKVDGLAEVLAEHAAHRQVVVFTHDDRLTQAVRQLVRHARILQVDRGAGSRVEVSECQSPARRYLQDARDLLADEHLPPAVIGRTLPNLIRLAVEAATQEVYFARQLGAGAARRDVEATWAGARGATQRVALAVDGRVAARSRWVEQRPYRQRTVKLCGRAVHDGTRSDAGNALDDARKTIADLLGGH